MVTSVPKLYSAAERLGVTAQGLMRQSNRLISKEAQQRNTYMHIYIYIKQSDNKDTTEKEYFLKVI